MTAAMTIPAFQAKWRANTLTERAAAQSHFIDLCHALGVPTPSEADPNGSFYAFERGAEKTDGGQGWADVWLRGHFAWEYKKKQANLRAAYRQLRNYTESLENPPLLVVCDIDRFEIRTNFTGTATKTYAFTLDELDQPQNLAVLRALWDDPASLKPDITPEQVTRDAAERFGRLASSLHARGVEPRRAAHFLVQLLFCLFAEDVGLLPNKIFGTLLRQSVDHPERFSQRIENLLRAMRDGGDYGSDALDRFNGGLFAEIAVEPLDKVELRELADAATLDWSNVEPAIFGTLFERSLDPTSRAQLGAHYTGRADIERVVQPVILAPLRRRWDEIRTEADRLKADWDATPVVIQSDGRRNSTAKDNRLLAFRNHLFAWQEELAAQRVLDPACGSGNFLYVALSGLLDLEKAMIAYGAENGLPMMFPRVGPRQLHGLELNEYAVELAQVVVWIGYLQWMTANGFQVNRDPVLESLGTIRLQDALLDRSDPEHPKEATWPTTEFIVGNPPFLGGNRVRAELGDEYVETLFEVYGGRVPAFADLVCYFFEKARAQIEHKVTQRAGLLATNSIRGGVNREVLKRIKKSGDIFMAWSDEPWILEGAAVRISLIGFDGGYDNQRVLNGLAVSDINADLTSKVNVTLASKILENKGVAVYGSQQKGSFDISADLARKFLDEPSPFGRPNSDVVKKAVNGVQLLRGSSKGWVIDFGVNMPIEEAAQYEGPFEYVSKIVLPERKNRNESRQRSHWWLHARPSPNYREIMRQHKRYPVTPSVGKHRIFVWLDSHTLADHALIVFARDDDYFFGVLHSRAHELWSLRMGTSLEDRPRYTPTTCFETFPLPWPPGQEPVDDPRVQAIEAAAKELDETRRRWLDPPDATPEQLKKRTLTNLYNERPAWLTHLHAALDRAVWTAYGWSDDPATTTDEELLGRLLALNQERAGVTAD